MIQVFEHPGVWTSAYQPSIFKFCFGLNVGNYNISSVDGFAVIVGGAIRLELTSYLAFDNGVSLVIGQVTEVVGADVKTNIPFTSVFSSWPVYRLYEQPIKIRIETARLSIGEPLKTLGVFYAIFKDGLYTFDVQGFVQKAFQNIGLPPDNAVTTNDIELYTQYRLVLLFDNLEFNIGGVYNLAYSTLPTLTSGQPLRVGPIEAFNGRQSIFSEIIGNKVITLLL